MGNNLSIVLAALGVLGIGGISGAYFNHLFEKRKELELLKRSSKEEQYKKFLENVLSFFSGWENKERKKNFMEELYVHAPLYASAKVIRLANEFLSSFKKDGSIDLSKNGKSDLYYKKLVVAIREDMGIWKKDKLEEKDIEILSLD